jgi:cob(I)alamin adenosyltransferase
LLAFSAAVSERSGRMSIATKTGDDGTTAVMFGRRVLKTHPRVVACGSVDELNAALGLARAFAEIESVAEAILQTQKELVSLMGELAVFTEDRERYASGGYATLSAEAVERLTALIDYLEQHEKISYRHWATPGATRASAFFDHARTVCRRAEREVVALRETGEPVNPEAIRYLNRLSDLCWLYALLIETKAGVG